jgi:cytochrome P450
MSENLTGNLTDAAPGVPDFPMARSPGCPFAPPPKVLALNAEKQLSRVRIWDGSTPWLITGYEAIRSLFTDPRASVDDRRPGYPHWNEGMLATVHTRPRSVFTSDAEEHTRFRRMLSKPFTFKRVEGLRPAVGKISDDHIDAMLGGPQPADIVGALALPIPSLVISKLLGVPYEDAGFFQEQAHKGVGRYATAEDSAKGAASLAKYLANLLRTRMNDPIEDLVSDLAERVKAEEISVREAAQLATGVLIAGHETTANMIGLGALALLEHPDQLQLLRDTDDPKVIATAVEELMRYLSIIQTGQRRIAVEDIDVAGETILAGEGIILDVAPANWDIRQFPEPDRLDLHRDDGPHVGFGYGRHQCVGQQLARMELQIVLHTLLRRIPTLRLAVPIEQVPFKHDTLAYGVYELPVTW